MDMPKKVYSAAPQVNPLQADLEAAQLRVQQLEQEAYVQNLISNESNYKLVLLKEIQEMKQVMIETRDAILSSLQDASSGEPKQ